MSWLESVSLNRSGSETSAAPFGPQQAAMLGAMSPLWMMFVGASTMGIAYWGMTRWMTMADPQRFSAPVVKLRLVPPMAREAEPEVAPEPLAATVDTTTAEVVESEPQAPAMTAAEEVEPTAEPMTEPKSAVGEMASELVRTAAPRKRTAKATPKKG